MEQVIQKRPLILLNGPPRSGKDEGAKYLYHKYNAHWFRMSQPIKDAVRAMFNMTDAQQKHCEEHKDTRLPFLFDCTYREVQIAFSEIFAKELFGVTVFGRLAARRIAQSATRMFVCSDSGFMQEAHPIVQQVGAENVLVIRLHRRGTSFDGDSRSYISIDGATNIDLENHGSLALYHERLDGVVTSWLETLAVSTENYYSAQVRSDSK